MFKYYLVFILIMSIITFILYAVDKSRSKRKAWRIPEATLLLFSFLGGAVGGYIGMTLLHHKTKHWYFQIVNIFSIVFHIIIGYLLLK